MKQILVMMMAAALFVAAVTAEAASLRADATIEGDRITVGDLFEDAGEVAGRTVGRAPEPGRRAVFDAAFLARIARGFGLPWRPASVHDRVVLTRASTVVRATDVQIVLDEAIAARVPEGRVELEVDNRLMEVHLPAGETPDAAPVLVVETLDHDRSHGRFSATVLARTPTGEARFPVSGRALAVVDLPVLNRTIRSGEVIGDADITWIEQRMTRNADRAVRDAADLVGMSPRRTLPPNAPVHPRDLRQPSLVARGSLVTMVLESRSMTLTAQGRALQDGADGDVVRVVNTMSNRTIEATVAGPGLVAVSRPSTAAQF